MERASVGRGKTSDGRRFPVRTSSDRESPPPSPAFRPTSHGGAPLAARDRARFEPQLGFDFSHVRIFSGHEGERITGSRGAAAVTTGQNVYLSPGGPTPGTPRGDRMLAHELIHTAHFARGAEGGGGNDVGTLEREAAAVSSVVASGGAAEIVGRAPPGTPPLHDDPTPAPSGGSGVRLTGVRFGHMPTIGMTLYYEIELSSPMTAKELYNLLFEGGKPPVFWTVAPLPKGAATPAQKWLIGGPYFYISVAGYGGKSFDSAIKDPVGKELNAQFLSSNFKPTQPDWFSSAAAETLAKTGALPSSVEVKLSPKAGSTIWVWRNGDAWYWYDSSTGELQAFWRDPSKTGFGEKRYNDWVIQYIELGKKPADAMDQTVKDMQETNFAILGAFALAMSTARPMAKAPPEPTIMPRVRTPRSTTPPVRPPTVEPPPVRAAPEPPAVTPPVKAPVVEPPPVRTPTPPEPTPPVRTQAPAETPPTKVPPAEEPPTKVPPAEEPANAPSKAAAPTPYRPCFVAGTLVQAEGGVLSIEDLVKGTRVLARAEGESQPAPQTVIATHGGATRTVVHVQVGAATVTCTRHHPFHVLDRGWIEARDLAAGDRLEALAGGDAIVDAVVTEHLDGPRETFNITVAEASTYFVYIGETPVLVHNGDLPDFNRVLYWYFSKKPAARGTDVDGISTWKTSSREQVNTLFESRVNESGRPATDPHSFFTPEELERNGLVAPETPGDPRSPLTGKLTHHSVRPAANPNPAKALSADEITALNKTAPQAGGAVIKPKDLKC